MQSTLPPHLARGVPDLRVELLPARYEELLGRDLPLRRDEVAALRAFAPRFDELCGELAGSVPPSIQHDDLHHANLWRRGDAVRILDWGDASVAHPFFSLVVPFRFHAEQNAAPPDDPGFGRLRDAYLESWGHGLHDVFALALAGGPLRARVRLGAAARPPGAADRAEFDPWFQAILRRALAAL